MSVIEIDQDEAAAFDEAVAAMHETCERAREIRDACERGELELCDEEGRELVETVRDKLEFCERWQIALRFQKITVPDPLPDEPKPPQRKPPVAYARVGQFGIVSYGASPNATFGNAVLRPGDWYGK
jgi:hypothetical protein